jgi:hypothetical protein
MISDARCGDHALAQPVDLQCHLAIGIQRFEVELGKLFPLCLKLKVEFELLFGELLPLFLKTTLLRVDLTGRAITTCTHVQLHRPHMLSLVQQGCGAGCGSKGRGSGASILRMRRWPGSRSMAIRPRGTTTRQPAHQRLPVRRQPSVRDLQA